MFIALGCPAGSEEDNILSYHLYRGETYNPLRRIVSPTYYLPLDPKTMRNEGLS